MKDEPISRLMQVGTRAIAADDKVPAIETFLTSQGLHWAPVIGDRGELIGVISATDLVRFQLDKGAGNSIAAWQLCTYKPITVDVDTPIGEVARLMRDHHIHHVVVTEHGAMRGVVSAMDFVKTFT
jgi:CBS domain-containing protein